MDLGTLASAAAAYAGYTMGGAPGAALGSAALNYLGAQDTNQANADRADAANAWSANQYANRYQTMVKDLEAAGLNPMLAYSQSPGSAPSAQQVTFQNPMSAATQGYQQVASASQANAEVEKTKHVNAQIDATVEKIKEETKKIPNEVEQIRFVIQKLAEEAANLAQDTENKIVLRKQMLSMIGKLNAETGLLNNQLQVEKALDNFGRTSKEALPMAKFLLDLFRSVK